MSSDVGSSIYGGIILPEDDQTPVHILQCIFLII